MFGMGFMEILLIAIVAIVALGPDKLPKAMVEVARFLKKFKSGVEDAKSTLDNELNISEMKEEANKFKAQIDSAKSTASLEHFDLGVDDLLKDELDEDEDEEETPKKDKKEKVSFKSQNKKKEKVKEEPKETIEEAEVVEVVEEKKNAADKFKVNQNEENV